MEATHNRSTMAMPDSVVLDEEIDPNYEPTEREVQEYASWLGMDLETEQDLFWIAREGLKAPLPENWKPCKTTDTEEIYYFNFATGQSTWDHPCDEYYPKIYDDHKKRRSSSLTADSNSEGCNGRGSIEADGKTVEGIRRLQRRAEYAVDSGVLESALANAIDSIVLEETVDLNYEPTQQKVDEYARWLGMGVQAEQDLLWIARNGLTAALPATWKPCKTTDKNEIFYFNIATGQSTWDRARDKANCKLYADCKAACVSPLTLAAACEDVDDSDWVLVDT